MKPQERSMKLNELGLRLVNLSYGLQYIKLEDYNDLENEIEELREELKKTL